MTTPAWSHRRLTLHGRLALGALLSTVVSLLVFALAAFVFILIDELEEEPGLTLMQVNWETAQLVLGAMAVATPFALVIAVGGSFWLSRRVLVPLHDVVHAAREMTARDLQRRLPVPEIEDELQALVLAQNALFSRLEQGFRALDRFASDASHELRTPLAVIGSELEIALRRPRTPEQWQSTAERSLDELHRLHRVIEALIELARADAASPLSDEVVAVRAILVDAHTKYEAEAATCGIEFSFSEDAVPENRFFRGNAEALGVALSNILSNAFRYTPHGGKIGLDAEIRSSTRIAIHVEDSGSGVDAEETDRIFEPFVQGALGRAADIKEPQVRHGIGLGLSITKRIVERHGGTVAVTRSPYGGARFTLELPIVNSEDSTE